ncbi:MAG: hypothetical protein ACK4M9_02850 [Anaerobacillus sp.]|uniref:hypothetical protein n=1 Tax=Anaerobacillus sp. TaxID=1872506 RepID=UPI0039191769
MAKNKFNSFSENEWNNLNSILDHYKLSPQQIAVIAAILFDALYVKSILVDREQTIVILLEGSLKQQSKNMEKLLNELRKCSIEDLMDILSSRKK